MSLKKNFTWKIKSFEELTNTELYNILHARAEVFIIEQKCPYQDVDGKDAFSFHVMGLNHKQQLVAYARVLPAGVSFQEVSIGRVLTVPAARGTGAGIELMHTALQTAEQNFGKLPIRIGAQLYLKKFYETFGFIKVSDMYLEDGIEHIEMLRQSQ